MADLETIQYQVEEDNAGQRLDIFLATQNPSHSRSSLHKLITEGMVKINSLLPKASYVVKKGEKVIVRYPVKKLFPSAENNAFSIIFEDEVLLVVDKPAGMSVHPTTMEEKGTLVQAILHHSARIADAVYDPESAISRMRPGIVHRLDKDTTGVLVIAKTTEALKALSDQFRLHTVVKEYQAIVYGALTDPTTVHTNIGRKPMKRSLMGVKEAGEGREAITHFYPEKTLFWKPTEQEATLTKCIIETGRTHQIRVHAKHIGHPVLGDETYTNKPAKTLSRQVGAMRQLLHAAKLEITHPTSGERLIFTANMPADMQIVLTKLQSLGSL